MDPLRVAVIGAGRHARVHFSMIDHEPDMLLVAVAEIDPDRIAQVRLDYAPLRVFTDYIEMLDTCDLDVVYVETMPAHLTGIVIDCLARDLHTSIEKPVGMSSREAERMLTMSRRSKGKAMVSVNRRYHPEVLAVKNLILEHGGAKHVAATYNKPRTDLFTFEGESLLPAPIICDAIHHVDLLRWLAGPSLEQAAGFDEVYAFSRVGPRPGSFHYNATIHFDNDCQAVMMSHYDVGFRIQRAEAHAEGFSAYLDLTTNERRCELYKAGAVYETPLDFDSIGGPEFNETRHFVECIREDKEPWSGLEDLVKTMRLCEAIANSVKGRL